MTSLARRALVFGLMTALAHISVHAADSNHPIRLIVPTPPGSAADALARAVSTPWAKSSGRPIVVENIVGAGTSIGTAKLTRSPNDGLTLAIISSNHTINPWVYKGLPFDAIADITPIAMIGSVPAMLVANNKVAANTPKELEQLAKSAETPLAEGLVSGSAYQMASEVFKEQAGITTNRIPYKGSAQILNDLLGGTLDIAIINAQLAAPQVAAGKLKGLAVTTSVRAGMAPQIPTLRESGYPNYEVEVWLALAGPAGLSAINIAARRAEFETALSAPEMKQAMESQGILPIAKRPDEILPFLKAELERNRAVIERVGMTAD